MVIEQVNAMGDKRKNKIRSKESRGQFYACIEANPELVVLNTSVTKYAAKASQSKQNSNHQNDDEISSQHHSEYELLLQQL
jgi:hypothetical protein